MATAAKKWTVRFAGELKRSWNAAISQWWSCVRISPASNSSRSAAWIYDGYRLVYVEDEEEVMGVAGFRILQMLVTSRVLYVDDLVIVEERARAAMELSLFNWLVHYAKCRSARPWS